MPASSSTLLSVPPSLPPPHSPVPESPSPSLSAGVFGAPLPPEQRSTPLKKKAVALKRANRPKIDFDPVLVAKRGEGWDEMLGGLLKVWVEEAAKEVREDVGLEAFDEGNEGI